VKKVLEDRLNLPRPTVPLPAQMGPTKTLNNRSSAIQKRDPVGPADEGSDGGDGVDGKCCNWRWAWGRAGFKRRPGKMGMSMMLCFFFLGKLTSCKKNVITRNRRRALSVWSSGDRECLQFQPDCFLEQSQFFHLSVIYLLSLCKSLDLSSLKDLSSACSVCDKEPSISSGMIVSFPLEPILSATLA